MSGSYGVQAASVVDCTLTRPRAMEIVEAGLPQWFAVQTRYRFEKRVVAQLSHKRCEVYLPLLTEHHNWSDRQKVVTTPLFPGYAFVHIDRSRDAREAVLQTAGLIGFVSFGGSIAAVPAKQIENLQLLLREKGLFSLHSFVQAGQRVRIRGGCLHGLEGMLVKHEKGKLLISIESIQRSLAIEIQGFELEPV
jgi:transcription antitermination factor NusG